MRVNHNLFSNILPQTPLLCGTPTLSLPGLLDLLDALEPELQALPGLASLWAEELRRDLSEAVKSDG
jgi:hypothetical protein